MLFMSQLKEAMYTLGIRNGSEQGNHSCITCYTRAYQLIVL